MDVKEQIENFLEEKFNFVLVNYYHDGSKNIGAHSDDEKDLVENSVIASLSLGATRIFKFHKKKSKETISMKLEDNSLITMEGQTQKLFKHSVPKQSVNIVKKPRINMTFRQMKI